MTEVARFFDAQSYSEGDQAEVQARFRSTGVLIEVAGGKLFVSASGSMSVSVADGEAMVEGFWYKNTASITLPITNNSSGSQRIDRVVLRLNRTSNSLAVSILQGTPGAGPPALTRVVGGTWELLLADITVNTGVLAIADDLVLNYSTFSGYFFDRPRANLLDNPTFRVNQRNTPAVVGSANGYVADRWLSNSVAASYYQSQLIGVYPPNMGYVTPETSRCIYSVRLANTADGTTTFLSTEQTLTGDRAQPVYGQSMCLSWWTYSARAGIIGASIDLGAAPKYRYIIRYAHSQPNAWQYHWVVIPWNPLVGLVNGSAAALTVRFTQVAGSTYRHSSSNAWFDASVLVAKCVGPDFSSIIQSTSDMFWIYQPKLEVGTYPTRFEVPDPMLELMQCYKQLFVLPSLSSHSSWIVSNANVATAVVPPVPMRADSVFQHSSPAIVGLAPTGNQIAYLMGNGWMAGMTFSALTLWASASPGSANIISTSSTAGNIATVGLAGIMIVGPTAVLALSAEL